jgi:CRP-like cAMP-binding protein
MRAVTADGTRALKRVSTCAYARPWLASIPAHRSPPFRELDLPLLQLRPTGGVVPRPTGVIFRGTPGWSPPPTLEWQDTVSNPTDGPGSAAPAAPPEPRNRLLRAIPREEFARLRPHLELVALEPLERLAELGEPIPHVHFPETGIISLVSCLPDGTLVEHGTVGYEGMAGVPLVLGVKWTPALVLGEVPGTSWRLDAARFVELLPTLPALEALLRRYAVYLLAQVSQALACNALHVIEQRCARWLLMTHDRVEGDAFLLTHEVLAQMLAVSRPSVSLAAEALRARGLIGYGRERITVLDRRGLEGAACECYGIVRAHRDRLLGPLEG